MKPILYLIFISTSIFFFACAEGEFNNDGTNLNPSTVDHNLSGPVSIAILQDLTVSSREWHHIPVISEAQLDQVIDLVKRRGGQIMVSPIFKQSSNYPPATLSIHPNLLPCHVVSPSRDDYPNPFEFNRKMEYFRVKKAECDNQLAKYDRFFEEIAVKFRDNVQTVLYRVRYDRSIADIHGALNRSVRFHQNTSWVDTSTSYTILISDGINERPDISLTNEVPEGITHYLLHGTEMAKGDYLEELKPKILHNFDSIISHIDDGG